ncbi:hypothetical protein CRG98_016466 [Punica granatum]|uniref:Uncharacterized protein n=1 Tax=Punica granatum TaxID=22663 RepID=A0A2I0K3L3_PUNGR|nr:hypothetical protein CRG98_016466 [Punica granatum]
MGSNALCTPSARYPSAEWGLALIHYLASSKVYVEDDSDQLFICKDPRSTSKRSKC